MDEKKQVFSRNFKLGIALIAGSLISSYASLAVLGGAVGTGKTWLRDLCIAVWFLTWIPFLAGFAMSGKEGVQRAMGLIKKLLGNPEWVITCEEFFSGLFLGAKERLTQARDSIKKYVSGLF